MDKVAQRLADRASELFGVLIDIPFSAWEYSSDRQREFWRELARVSQEAEEEAIEPEAESEKPARKAKKTKS